MLEMSIRVITTPFWDMVPCNDGQVSGVSSNRNVLIVLNSTESLFTHSHGWVQLIGFIAEDVPHPGNRFR